MISTLGRHRTSPGFSGDGGPGGRGRSFASRTASRSIASGRLLICDIGNQRIRRVDLATGIIDTYAGTGVAQPHAGRRAGGGTPLNGPRTMVFDEKGDIYLALREGNAIYRIAPAADTLHHVAGTGKQGYSGDGGPARAAELAGPKGLAYARRQPLRRRHREPRHPRRSTSRSGIITTVIGTGQRGDGPETDPLQCRMSRPHGLTVDAAGVLYVTDSEAHRIRMLKSTSMRSHVRRGKPCLLNTSIVCLSTALETISPTSIPRSFVSRWPQCRRTGCGGGRTRIRTASAICCCT